MMRIDHAAFVSTAVLLVLLLRAVPRSTGRRVHALVSVAVLALALGDARSALATALFAFVPFVVVRVKRELPTWAFAAVVGVQLLALAVLRRYFPAIGLGRAQLPVEVVGLSYIVLRQIEWMLWMDADEEAPVDLLAYTNFTLGFFTLLAGPVARYDSFTAAFLSRERPERPEDLVGAINRIVNGYACVVLLAPLLGAFTATEGVTSGSARMRDWLLFVYLFPLQLYLNFAGYSSIVIGFAKLCRIELPENFARPFGAPNVQEYWQRWHMSFSFWMRDLFFYPFMKALQRGPLRGRARAATALSLFACFLLIGVWHGPAFGFVVFGVMHGLAVLAVQPYTALLERALGKEGLERYERSRALRVLRVAATYSYVALSSVCFERSAAQLATLARHFARAAHG
jgi:D-alanyl-lipoteichoic acid acyltransferase DltB (MBOAT superfamily)